LDYSVLTGRSLAEIGGDQKSAEWESNRKAPVRKGAEWLFENKSKSVKKDVSAKASGSRQTVAKRATVKPAAVKKTPRSASSSKRQKVSKRLAS
jgi:hypothetical protein